MMNLKSWLVLSIFILWGIFCWQWYTCGLKGLCVFDKTNTYSLSASPSEPSIAHQTDTFINETITAEVIDKTFTITFGHNSISKDTLADSDKYINKLAKELKSNGKKLLITGHTDITENKKLDRQRAWLIKSELMKLGVNPNQLITAGKKSLEPVADNSTSEGRHKNRRVVLKGE